MTISTSNIQEEYEGKHTFAQDGKSDKKSKNDCGINRNERG